MATLLFPPSIDWELTESCNHKCVHCYNYWRQGCCESKFKDESYYLDIASRIINEHPVSVQITGGEPLLTWNKVSAAIDLLVKSGIIVSINTNATFVTKEIATFLGKNKIDAFISFPCLKPDIFEEIVGCKGAYERALKGIHLLNDNNVRISLNMVVTKRNLPYVYDTAKFVHDEFGAQYFSATKASFPVGAISDFRNQMLSSHDFNYMLSELMRAKRDFGIRVDSAWVYSLCGFDDEVREQFGFNRKCTCGKYSFVLDADGNIKACGCDPVSYGNLTEVRFADAIRKMRKWQDGSMLPDKCKACKWLLYCGSGCRFDAFSYSKSECAFDSVARPEMAKENLVQRQESVFNDKSEFFVINPEAVIIEENGFCRISYKTNYDFISHDFSKFLLEGNYFSIESLVWESKRGKEEISMIVHKMVRKGLLVKTNKERIVSQTADGFELLVSPYEEPYNQQWQNDYAGFKYSCKQFM